MNFNKFYKIIYFFMTIAIIIMIATPIIFKIKLHNLKAREDVEYTMSNKGEFISEDIPLYDIIRIINNIEEVSIEDISLNDEYKEIILNSDVRISLLKEILQELMLMEEVIDVTNIKLKEKNWIITVLFN